MGESRAAGGDDEQDRQRFVRALLDDVSALERMLDSGLIESGVRRIGAEQEIFLVDRACEAAPVAPQLLERLARLDPEGRGDTHPFTTELARFNLEANLPPWKLGGDVLSRVEAYLNEKLELLRTEASELGADVFLTGILPTLRMSDLTLDNMTPAPRYRNLNDTTVRMRSGAFEVDIKGIDDFYTVHDNVMLESCNTSFQLHFQFGGEEFAPLYNLAQAITAPVLAAAVNSPVLAEHRLWHETRIALFQRSIDSRRASDLSRGHRPRVHFGDRWVERSILRSSARTSRASASCSRPSRGRTRWRWWSGARCRSSSPCGPTTAPSTAGTGPATGPTTGWRTSGSRTACCRPGRPSWTRWPTRPSTSA
jgi:hypothetical protein